VTNIFIALVVFSGVSFVIYGGLLFTSPVMQNEFKRFELERFTRLVGLLEILGGIGLLVGLKFQLILLIASGGLAILMLLGFGVRLKMKDGLWLSFPSIFFMFLNVYIFLKTV